ncbi:hypothetical protein [Maritimibacter sp. UBA3975]|uniref:hypothetical protein n=1 Tax=Maritimibacter sp. UBA3975 TaxID=1946833 RepID=UPI0025C25823|nr:hypothetical protein [Maritimibacter sp. UBA3975]
MSREHQRRIARLEAASVAVATTAIGVVPTDWTEERANCAIAELAKSAGHAGPMEVMALRTSGSEPSFVGVCDLQELLGSIASAGRRITDDEGKPQ